MKVVMLQDWHGLEYSVGRQIGRIPELAPDPKTTVILHEPIASIYIPYVNMFLTEQCTLDK